MLISLCPDPEGVRGELEISLLESLLSRKKTFFFSGKLRRKLQFTAFSFESVVTGGLKCQS
jgi:hypothetical protein